MNIAIISDGTFSDEYYKEYFSICKDTELIYVDSQKEELPETQIDVIAVDYYNENIDINRITYFSEQHPESLVIILADIDIDNDDFKKEERILKNFKVDYASCYNIKDTNAESFYEFAKVMIETKNECENIESPFSTNVCLYVLAFIVLIILGILHYFH